METVRTGLGDGIYDSAGGLPVLSREAAGQYRELLNGVHAQGGAEDVARAAVGVIIDANSIQPVVVVCRSLAGDGEFRPEAPVSARGGGVVHLGLNQVDTRVRSSQRSPVAPVQRQLEHGLRFDLTHQR